MKCPVCGGESWRTTVVGKGFHITECSSGCIGRTVPPPEYSPDLPEGAGVENLSGEDSGHFRLAAEIVDIVGRVQPSGKLLDVDSGWGQLLKLAGDRGYDAVGLEASAGAADTSRQAFGVNVIEGSFPDYRFEPCSFDIIVINHVIEHLEDMVRVLAEARRILKPGGVIAVSAPNFNSLMSRVKAERWQGLQPSQHIWQLSADTVAMLLQRVGLTAILVRHGRLDYRRGSGSLPKWLVLRMILRLADVLKMGDNMIVLGRKPFCSPLKEGG